MPDPSASQQQAWPVLRFEKYGELTGPGTLTVLDGSAVTPSAYLVDTIDLVDTSLVANDQAHLEVNIAGVGSGPVWIFRAFVYSSSQGYFPWRGSFLLVPGLAIVLGSTNGTWHVTIGGTILPGYARA